jgi:hypothetical protein
MRTHVTLNKQVLFAYTYEDLINSILNDQQTDLESLFDS